MGEDGVERLFLALWPAAHVRRELAAARDRLVKRTGGRPTSTDSLHLTLAFLGDTEPARRAVLVECMAGIVGEPVVLSLDRFGVWEPPGIGWIGPHAEPPALLQLVDDIRRGLHETGLPVERRPYRAHVTLIRRAHHPPRLPPVHRVDWRAESFVLVRSALATGGSRYEIVREWPLRGGAENAVDGAYR